MFNNFFKQDVMALYFQLLSLLTYIYVGIALYDFPRNLNQYFILICIAIFLDQFLNYMEKGKLKLIFSPIIIASAVFMLVTSFSLNTYIAAIFVAVLSKYLIRIDGRHIFNPANLGVLFAVVIFRDDVVVVPGQWGVENEFILLAALLGLLASSFAKRIFITIAYIGTFAVLAFFRSYIYQVPILFTLGPLFGMAGVIFQFHMITDPQTTPSEYRHQFLFGSAVAILDIFLRTKYVLFSQFFSLGIICALYAYFYKRD